MKVREARQATTTFEPILLFSTKQEEEDMAENQNRDGGGQQGRCTLEDYAAFSEPLNLK